MVLKWFLSDLSLDYYKTIRSVVWFGLLPVLLILIWNGSSTFRGDNFLRSLVLETVKFIDEDISCSVKPSKIFIEGLI